MMLQFEYNLHGTVPALASKSSFDASSASIDLSQSSSTVEVTSNSGHATVKLWLSDGSMVVNAFPWVRAGDLIVAQNPSAVDGWLSQHLDEIVDAELDLGSLSGTGGSGPNTVVAEAVYGTSILAGTSHSWYNPCNPSDPSGQCQIP